MVVEGLYCGIGCGVQYSGLLVLVVIFGMIDVGMCVGCVIVNGQQQLIVLWVQCLDGVGVVYVVEVFFGGFGGEVGGIVGVFVYGVDGYYYMFDWCIGGCGQYGDGVDVGIVDVMFWGVDVGLGIVFIIVVLGIVFFYVELDFLWCVGVYEDGQDVWFVYV